MKNIIFFLTILTIFSCIRESEKKTALKKNVIKNVKKNHFKLDTVAVVLVKFDNGLYINWDNNTGSIKKDKLFKNIMFNFDKYKAILFENLTNLKNTSAISCAKKTNLVVGDISYLLIDEIKILPNYEILNTQCDTFDNNCKYPIGLFSAIEQNRKSLKSRIIKFLNNSKKKSCAKSSR